MTNPNTETRDIAELVKRYRILAENPRLASLPDGDATQTADALEALQARVLMVETANMGYRMEREEDHATIASLREALEIIAGDRQCVDNLMSDKDIARQALTLPPDIGTTPKEENG